MSTLITYTAPRLAVARKPAGYKKKIVVTEDVFHMLLDRLSELVKRGFEIEIVKIKPLSLEEEMAESERTGHVKLRQYTAVNVYAAIEEARKLSYQATAAALHVESELEKTVHERQALELLKRAGAIETLAATRALLLPQTNPIRKVVELSMRVLTPTVAKFISYLILKVLAGWEPTEHEKERLRVIRTQLQELESAIEEVLKHFVLNQRARLYYSKLLRRVKYLKRVVDALLQE